jgi:dTDP-glucose pyrophosphorylase
MVIMNSWQEVLVQPSSTIRETLQKIDASSLQIALVVDKDRRLLGTVTDGDVRRGLLQGLSLEETASKVMNQHPTIAGLADDRGTLLAAMHQQQIYHVPLVDGTGCVAGLETLKELLKPSTRDNVVLIMAGGQGQRLRPMTEDCPKPMLFVGSRPLLETILLNFIEYGFRRFYVAVNHKAEAIMSYFEDGSRWSVQIDYIRETQKMGTAGALSLLPERPTGSLVVMNGDLLTKVNLNHLLDFHAAANSIGTMCVREYELRVPYGVIRVNGHEILAIEEKPTQKVFVNAGIYVLEPEALNVLPALAHFDMTQLFEKLVEMDRKTAVFPLREYWLDIGQPSDFIKAKTDFEHMFK